MTAYITTADFKKRGLYHLSVKARYRACSYSEFCCKSQPVYQAASSLSLAATVDSVAFVPFIVQILSAPVA